MASPAAPTRMGVVSATWAGMLPTVKCRRQHAACSIEP